MTKLVYAQGGNAYNVLFFESVVALPFLYALTRLRGASLRIDRKTLGKTALLGVVGNAGTTLLLGLTYAHLAAGMTTMLHYTYPISTTLILVLLFREKLQGTQGIAMLLTVGGAAAISLEGGLSGEPLWIGVAVLSGVFWAFYIVFLDKSGLKNEDSSVVNFYSTLFGAFCYGVLGALTGNLRLFHSWSAWLIVIAVGLLGRALAGIFFQNGVRGVGPITTCVLSTFEPLTSLFMGILLLREALTLQHGVGALLILIGSVLIVIAGSRNETPAAPLRRGGKDGRRRE